MIGYAPVKRLATTTLCLLLGACIERAQQPAAKRQEIDRSAARDVVVPSIPPNARPAGARFGASGDQIELVAVAFDPPNPQPGSTVKVSFFYRCLGETEDNWKVFVHIEDGRGGRINGDHWPTGYGNMSSAGRYPTAAWRQGEIIRDDWAFGIPGYSDVDKLELWTGFYNPYKPDGDRLPLLNVGQIRNDGQNRAMVAQLSLRG